MKTRILIVDDSRIFRSALQQGLSRASDIEVIGSVWNGVKALEFLRENDPDLVTLDIQMPEMDGIETLQAIQKINTERPPERQIGVIMLSSHTKKGADITVKALEMGAWDFIPKPEGNDLQDNLTFLCQQLIVKIRNYAVRVRTRPKRKQPVTTDESASRKKKKKELSCSQAIRAVLIGVSTGGPKALAELLPPLCEKITVPILIVQHMPPTFTESLAKSLNAKCRFTVSEASDDSPVLEKHVYIAPGGRHMILAGKGDETRIRILDTAPEKGCRPSVDKLFRSGAEIYRQHVIGVILTGMGTDGTEGGKQLKLHGAPILVQDEQSSVVWGMPGSACGAGIVDATLPLGEIPDAIVRLIE
ncbi:MAG: chemotaxis response regulator protein-glutamate methylesterase [Desulfobulbaceae bacterium]